MKKIISVLIALALCVSAVFCFASCGEKAQNDTKDTDTSKTVDTDSPSKTDPIRVGVIQYMSHPSLDNCFEGIKEALTTLSPDIVIDRQTGSSASADADCTTYAKNMVASGYDMIIAIATPAAKAAFTATADTDIPVIFCAVSDPVLAGLVNTLEVPGDNCTGTSDVLDLEAQVNLITALQPDVKSIGILYTSSEDNSISNLARFREICDARNIEVVAKAVQNASDIPSAATGLAAEVDCINNFTDNNVVNNLSVVLSAADSYGIPVYGSEVEQVSNGCLASVSIDYVALGKVTGEMAFDVLEGADAASMAVRTISDATPVVNSDVLAALEIELPEEFADAEKVTTK